MKRIVILHADIPDDAPEDEKDVFQQVEAVSKALTGLTAASVVLPVSLNLEKARTGLIELQPSAVFNLVESLAGTGKLIHLIPALLEFLKIPFSGAGSESMILTTSKILSKERLQAAGIYTPAWQNSGSNGSPLSFDPPYIIKPVNEDASVGLDDGSFCRSRKEAESILKKNNALYGECFIEKYIDGREFNISILAGPDGPEVLPPAEIKFVNFPADKPKLVGYRAKWEQNSFEYRNTVRSFEFKNDDQKLINRLYKMSLDCWNLFRLRGYARVDLRVDESGKPWVLEINANPCISPDSGFMAAATQAGMTYNDVIERILNDIPGFYTRE